MMQTTPEWTHDKLFERHKFELDGTTIGFLRHSGLTWHFTPCRFGKTYWRPDDGSKSPSVTYSKVSKDEGNKWGMGAKVLPAKVSDVDAAMAWVEEQRWD